MNSLERSFHVTSDVARSRAIYGRSRPFPTLRAELNGAFPSRSRITLARVTSLMNARLKLRARGGEPRRKNRRSKPSEITLAGQDERSPRSAFTRKPSSSEARERERERKSA